MMIWMAKQLISTGFCIQIINGQKLSKTTIVGAESSDYAIGYKNPSECPMFFPSFDFLM